MATETVTGDWGNRHPLTMAETLKGASTSARNRKSFNKYVVRAQKQIEKMHIEGATLKELIKFAETVALTPVGSIVISWLIVDFFQKIGYINTDEALGLKAVTTSATVLNALGGGQGLGAVLGGAAKLGAG